VLHSYKSCVRNGSSVEIEPKYVEMFVLRQDKFCMGKSEVTCVENHTNFYSTQKFPTQARFQLKNDFEHKNC
jgi:hypothetical protein